MKSYGLIFETCNQNKTKLFYRNLQEFNNLRKLISLGVDWVFAWTESKVQSFPQENPL